MIILKDPARLQQYLHKEKFKHVEIAFVPTMGALHEGHLALIQQAIAPNRLVVCSIFVNPTQFNDHNDFLRYPITLEADIALLEKSGCQLLFLPGVNDLYPGGTSALEQYDLGYLETLLEGAFRPGHFQGVCQVMSRLLQAVSPHLLFMGRKDYQQCMVVNRLLQLTGSQTQLIACPTVREADGLALSSRNRRLSSADRQKAPAIYEALRQIRNHLQAGSLTGLKKTAITSLEQNGFTVDYVEIADAHTLMPQENWNGQQPLVALVAAFLGPVRLIDNEQLNS